MNNRRTFLNHLLAAGGVAAAAAPVAQAQTGQGGRAAEFSFLPRYARAQNYKSLKQSSFDRTGGNRDSWNIPAGGTHEVFNAEGPGIISHIWFTIAARGGDHLKEIVLRGYWDGNAKPSVEVPVGDFFGLNLNSYFHLPVGVPGLLARKVAELLLRHALPPLGALHRHQ